MPKSTSERQARYLKMFGIILFFFGLLTDFVLPHVAKASALKSFPEGELNGLLLLFVGVMWPRLSLTAQQFSFTFWSFVYGGFGLYSVAVLAHVVGADHMIPFLSDRIIYPTLDIFLSSLMVAVAAIMAIACFMVMRGLIWPKGS